MSHHHDKSMMNSTTADKLKELAADHVEDRGSEQGGGGGEHVMPESLRGLTPDEIHALTRKTAFMMDIVIMPCLIIMYIFNYLDRNSIAAAKLANLTEDLNLSATQYQTCVSILFVGYILMQVPSNMILGKLRYPGLYISCAMVLWGAVSATSGAATGFGSLVATRFFVGIAETVFFPGAVYYLSIFYNREQYAFRAAFLYCGSQLGNAFGGLLSIAILKLDGVHGLEGWRWLFILEGVITMGLSLVTALLLPHSPQTFRLLTQQQKDLVAWQRLQDLGQQDTDTEITARQGLRLALTDPKTWIQMAILHFISTTASVTNFFPSVVATLGYSRTLTYALTSPPFLLCVVTMLLNGFHSDRKRERYWHIVCPLCITVVANIIAVSSLNTAARYTAMMLMPTSFFAAYIVTLSWITGTLSQPAPKRAAAIALIIAVCNIPNIWTSYLYAGAPRYRDAFIVNLIAAVLAIVAATIGRLHLARLNARLDRGEDVGKHGPTAPQIESGYRYML